ncbi:MAG: exo-beta-N-acetylmuramidase NamZ domain-containing protein [Thermoanaerobaculia bacterium]
MKTARILPLVLLLAACVSSAPQLSVTPPQFDPAGLAEVDAAIGEAMEQKRIPGAVVRIERNGAVFERVYGNRAIEPGVEAMTADTIFDVASITKVVATAPSIWLLIERGKVDLDASVRTYLPEFTDPAVTVRHLLTHSSGLRPSLDLRVPWSGYTEGIAHALAEKPLNRPGFVFRYSDVGFIILGEIVRRVSGDPLDVFARREIFEPLGMTDSRFLPMQSRRIAPTERVDGQVLRGVVHDPTSRRMGGVAGHAGLFSTTADLAKFAHAMLGSGGGVWSAATVKRMTSVQSPPQVAIRRAGGFDIDSGYARPRGDVFPIGSFGHTGWTGGFLWIDPWSQTFYVALSNRVHPQGRQSVVALQKKLGTAVAHAAGVSKTDQALAPRPGGSVGWIVGGADAWNGVDSLHAGGYAPLKGKRVGLITNHTGIDRTGNPTADLLRSAPEVNLVALFSPEHGIRGTFDAKIEDSVDEVTGLPVHSLYGERRKPAPEQLAGLDVLVFDIQDIGARFYTYISTMGLAMEAAAEAGVTFLVLDRVNTIGGVGVEGPQLEGEADFVAWHKLPVRHGMTVGELAEMFRVERGIKVDLQVVTARGWKREQWQDEAGLPWINTSPNMRSVAAAGLYPGIGLMESAISVGRGTDTPFEILGAPYLDGAALIREVGAIPGVAFEAVRFTPTASIHKGEECGGVRMRITDRAALRSVDLGVAIASALARLYPAQFPVDKMQRLLRHKPTLEAIRAGKRLEEMRALWDTAEFVERRKAFLKY